jgi:hypothetical protein
LETIAALTDPWWIPTMFGVVVPAVGNEVSRWYRRGGELYGDALTAAREVWVPGMSGAALGRRTGDQLVG